MMRKVEVAKVIGFYRRKGVRMAQVTVLQGKGAQQRSDNRHISFVGGTWVGNNPDPETTRQRGFAADFLTRATDNFTKVQGELDALHKSLTRELTEAEKAPFWAHGILTEPEIKATITRNVIPVYANRLLEAKMALDSAKANSSAIDEAYPATMQFVGDSL
jgi:hypothetical protein